MSWKFLIFTFYLTPSKLHYICSDDSGISISHSFTTSTCSESGIGGSPASKESNQLCSFCSPILFFFLCFSRMTRFYTGLRPGASFSGVNNKSLMDSTLILLLHLRSLQRACIPISPTKLMSVCQLTLDSPTKIHSNTTDYWLSLVSLIRNSYCDKLEHFGIFRVEKTLRIKIWLDGDKENWKRLKFDKRSISYGSPKANYE